MDRIRRDIKSQTYLLDSNILLNLRSQRILLSLLRTNLSLGLTRRLLLSDGISNLLRERRIRRTDGNGALLVLLLVLFLLGIGLCQLGRRQLLGWGWRALGLRGCFLGGDAVGDLLGQGGVGGGDGALGEVVFVVFVFFCVGLREFGGGERLGWAAFGVAPLCVSVWLVC